MVHPPYLIGAVKVCLLRRMRFDVNLQMSRRVNLRMRFILNLSCLNMQLFHMFRFLPLMDSGSNFLSVLRVPYLLEKGGRISQLGRQIMKVPGSKGVGIEEDVFLYTSLEVKEPTFIKG